VLQGGAVYYDFKRPSFSQITYKDNQAKYGPNVASYAVKLRINGVELDHAKVTDIGSGIRYADTIYYELLDVDNQVMVLNSQDQIVMTPVNRSLVSFTSTNSALLRGGVASFSDILVVAKPGSADVLIKVSCKAIDSGKIVKVFGGPISNSTISMSFRYCKPGEIQMLDNTCDNCDAGTYSLDWNSTQCKQCIEHSVCQGKTEIAVDSGYWRRTSNSTNAVE